MKNIKLFLMSAVAVLVVLTGSGSHTASAVNFNAPMCGLGASPGSITKGESTTLWWWSSNATIGTINGENVQVSGGSKYFSPSQTQTYSFNVTGPEGVKTCSTTISVNEPQADLPTCGIGASPHSIERGQGTAVWWWSDSAVSGMLNGTPVNPNGSQWLNPKKTTKYTFVGTGKSGSKTTCEMTVEVTEPAPEKPLCSTGFSTENVNRGDETSFWWWTDNATSVKVNGKEVSQMTGYTTFIPQKNEMYTLSATGPGGTTTCTSEVKVIDPKPLCAIGFSPMSSVKLGEGTTLWWWTQYGSEATINGEKVTVPQGFKYVTPNTTQDYTISVMGSGGTTLCTETLGVFSE